MNSLPKVLLTYLFKFFSSCEKLVLREVCTKFWKILFIGDFWVKYSHNSCYTGTWGPLQKIFHLPKGHYKHLCWDYFTFGLKDITIDKLIIEPRYIDNLDVIIENKIKTIKFYGSPWTLIKLESCNLNKVKKLFKDIKKEKLDPNTMDINIKYSYGIITGTDPNRIELRGPKIFNDIDFYSLRELKLVDCVFEENKFLRFPENITKLKIIYKHSASYFLIIYPRNLKHLTLNIGKYNELDKKKYCPWIREFPKSLKRLKIYAKILFSNYFEIKYK